MNTGLSRLPSPVYDGSVSHSINFPTCTNITGPHSVHNYSQSQTSPCAHLPLSPIAPSSIMMKTFSSYSSPAYPLTSPPHSPVCTVSSNVKSTFIVTSSQYTSPMDLNVDISNSVQVISATRVLATPQETIYRTSVPQPTHPGIQHTSNIVQSKFTGFPSHTLPQNVSVTFQCPHFQNVSHGQSYYSQPHFTPYTALQNTVYRGIEPQQQRTSSTRSAIKTHARAQSHGQLCFNFEPTSVCTSGRASLPHISLDVSRCDESGDNRGTLPTSQSTVEKRYKIIWTATELDMCHLPVQTSLSVAKYSKFNLLHVT